MGYADSGTETAHFMDTIAFYFEFSGCLLAALFFYGVLLEVSRLAPPKQKRFLFFPTQFFIKGFDARIAAAAIVLQILGIVFVLCQLVMVLHGWAT